MQESESGIYEKLCDYDLLERVSHSLHLEMTQENEERIINLHNHLIWRSYMPGRDDVTDAIFCAMLWEVTKMGSVPPEELPAEIRCMVCQMQTGKICERREV